ncbi:hypothetical protein DRH14_02455 [Candidatus Shapirobacteria bacterium]|nr:MAG: hypothetical protein DRH14_02455 [Candidatus Shapirobacteria bacterium]
MYKMEIGENLAGVIKYIAIHSFHYMDNLQVDDDMNDDIEVLTREIKKRKDLPEYVCRIEAENLKLIWENVFDMSVERALEIGALDW